MITRRQHLIATVVVPLGSTLQGSDSRLSMSPVVRRTSADQGDDSTKTLATSDTCPQQIVMVGHGEIRDKTNSLSTSAPPLAVLVNLSLRRLKCIFLRPHMLHFFCNPVTRGIPILYCTVPVLYLVQYSTSSAGAVSSAPPNRVVNCCKAKYYAVPIHAHYYRRFIAILAS